MYLGNYMSLYLSLYDVLVVDDDLAKYNYSGLKLLDHVKKGIKNVVFESLLAIAGY